MQAIIKCTYTNYGIWFVFTETNLLSNNRPNSHTTKTKYLKEALSTSITLYMSMYVVVDCLQIGQLPWRQHYLTTMICPICNQISLLGLMERRDIKHKVWIMAILSDIAYVKRNREGNVCYL